VNPADQSRFGRLAAPDSNDRRFAIRAAMLPARADLPEIMHWDTGKVLNQGNQPQCVAYAGEQWLNSSPIRQTWGASRQDLYNLCQRNDEWPGEDYDGTSVRALFKVLRRAGRVSTYGWAWDVDTIAAWVLSESPMVMGTDWHQGMDQTDKHGFVHASGPVLGGHAWLVKGCNVKKVCPDGSIGAFRAINSWGRGWGVGGYFWISFRDIAALVTSARFGEACTAVELPVAV
jgi:C1A family cysteine protease